MIRFQYSDYSNLESKNEMRMQYKTIREQTDNLTN